MTYLRSPCSKSRPPRPLQCRPRCGPPQSANASQPHLRRWSPQEKSKTNGLLIVPISDISLSNDISNVISAQEAVFVLTQRSASRARALPFHQNGGRPTAFPTDGGPRRGPRTPKD